MVRLPPSLPLIEDVVADLVENPNRIITRRELDGLGDIGATLSRWGALRPGETLTSIACTSCGDDHFVELDFDPATQMWRYYCGSVGRVAVASDDLVTFGFDLGWLADRLAEAAFDRSTTPPRISGRCALGPGRREPGRPELVGLSGPRR